MEVAVPPDRSAPESPRTTEAALGIVGIGASAGGLKALQAFFQAVPEDSGLAYVVVMHLDPDRESRLAALLQDRTPVPVAQATAGTIVEPNHVYVIRPGFDLELERGALKLVPRSDAPEHLPIDQFMRSLAFEQGADAIGVVLSGTGEDGSAGVRYIRERGGITVAQLPREADFDAMPTRAIATGQVDLVLPSGAIAAELVRMRRMPTLLEVDAPPLDTEAQLAAIFSVLQARTGHDFSQYKRPTVLRRLERRLRFNAARTLEAYLAILRAKEGESTALVRDLLISVTGFFRDPDAFTALASAIPQLFEGKGEGDAIRVWVVGCATGEEAYSIAMLLHEHAAGLEHPPRIQIFATDIDENGYTCGRNALYPVSTVENLPNRWRRFFEPEARGFRVTKALRESVLFAVHNVLQDPPFSRMDLISCRNLLIYLQPEAHAQVLETFHYSLREGGLLFLGSSEAIGDEGQFTEVDRGHRIFRRNEAPSEGPARISSADPRRRPGSGSVAPSENGAAAPAESFSWGGAHLQMLEAYAPPSLIVDENLKVVHLSGRAGRFLQLGVGEPSTDVIALARGELRMELRSALYQAFEKGVSARRQVRLGDGDDASMVSLQVHPSSGADGGRFALVMFGDESAPAAAADLAAAGSPGDLRQREAYDHLEEELRRLKEQLESTLTAHERSVEALQSANEELQSAIEEQRAATEELETSREEIQSINEELTTINQEHQSTIEEQRRTNADLENLIVSSEIGTVFLDRELHIRRFTPSVQALFNFVATDQGRPLGDITHHLDYPELIEDARTALASLEQIEREVISDSGQCYIVRVNAYHAQDGSNDGVVLTFFDNTPQKRVEEELRQAKLVAESANLAKGTFLATLSHEFRTPLNGILGWADLLSMDGELTPSQKMKVERITVGGWHLASMIDEILTFVKLDEGRETIAITRLDAGQVAQEAGALIEPAALDKGLAFVVESPDEPLALDTDAGKLRQILINLCGNAVKYTAQGEVRLRVIAEPERAMFEVSDTGIGIASENHVRIFERFFQVDSGSTRIAGGMGIGLAAAREYARLLGGDVGIESEVGKGATFRMWLPRPRIEA